MILGGDPLLGRALASLLQNVELDARYASMDYLEQPEALGGVEVLLLAPPWSGDDRKAARKAVRESTTTHIPILELGSPEDEVDPEHFVPWPCRTEDLRRRVNAALRAGRR